MKHFKFWGVFLLLILAVVYSCNEDDAPESYFLKLETTAGSSVDDTLFVDTDGTSQSFAVKSNGPWEITFSKGKVDWVSLHPNHGNENGSFNLLIEANETLAERETALSGVVNGEEAFVLIIKQKSRNPQLSVSPSSPEVVQNSGGIIEFTIEAETEWSYTIEEDSWLTEKSKTSTSLSLEASENMTTTKRETNVLFSLVSSPEVKQKVVISQEKMDEGPIADLIDLIFKADGTAEDISPKNNQVITFDGMSLSTFYSNRFERYIARFNHSPGNNSISSGFYKVDYTTDQGFKNAIADGHTLETLFMLDVSHPIPNAEIKMITSHQGGGTGLMLGNNSKGNSIIFLPHVGSGYVWANSNITPERGEFYHVVGVWNKSEGKAYIYVNGELKGTVNTSGNFNFPSAGSTWFGIGADPRGDLAEMGLKGEVAIARVYDKPLEEEDVEKLWQSVEGYKSATEAIELLGVSLQSRNVLVNTDYTIKGNGFQSGDKVKIVPLTGGGKEYSLTSTVKENQLTLTIPADFTSAKYRFFLVRGDKEQDMGFATLNVVDELPEAPEVIAHRGYWTTAGSSQNSVTALIKAQELDIYGSEFDVWITSDGVVVLNHDPTIDGIRIETSTYDDLKNVRLGNGEKIPTLNDYLVQGKKDPSTKLILEIKTHSTKTNNDRVAAKVVQMVKDANMTDQVEYIAFSLDVCKELLKLQPDAVVAYLSGNRTPQQLHDLGIKGIDYNASVIRSNKNWIAESHNLGMTVNVWTVNSESDLREMIDLGVDFITTDQPVLAKQLIEGN